MISLKKNGTIVTVTQLQKVRSKTISVEVLAIGAWAITSRKYPAKLCYSDGRGIV